MFSPRLCYFTISQEHNLHVTAGHFKSIFSSMSCFSMHEIWLFGFDNSEIAWHYEVSRFEDMHVNKVISLW